MVVGRRTFSRVCIRTWVRWGVFIKLRVMFWTAGSVGWLWLRVVAWDVGSFTRDVDGFTWVVWTFLSELFEDETTLIDCWMRTGTEGTFCRELWRFYTGWYWVGVAAFNAFRGVSAVGSSMTIGLAVKALQYLSFFRRFFNFDFCM